MRYCIDLDGTICTTPGMVYGSATPIPAAVQAVNALYDAGHTVIIDTARGSLSGIDWTALTIRQLADWGVRYHEVRCGQKIAADVYIDDRATNAADWMTDAPL